MELIFIMLVGIIVFYFWADLTKQKDRILRVRKERAKKWKKKTRKEKYGRYF